MRGAERMSGHAVTGSTGRAWQVDVLEVLVRTARHVALPAHCLAGVPEAVRSACSHTRVAASQHL